MKKENEDKLVNAIIDLHQEIKGLRIEMNNQLGKVNLALGELRLSYMKLDENFKRLDENLKRLDGSFNKYAKSTDALLQNHESRITHLEDKTGSHFVAREPKAGYKKKKKK